MKNNLPVTQTEMKLSQSSELISTTDLKGVITYANQDFIDISGFSLNELLGQSHNIVRHPDIPPPVFSDMWETLKQGKPWMAL